MSDLLAATTEVFNQSPPYAVSFASGPTYGDWSQILSPRILKGGVLFEF